MEDITKRLNFIKIEEEKGDGVVKSTNYFNFKERQREKFTTYSRY